MLTASLATRWAMYTGIADSTMTPNATALTIGSWVGRDRLAKIQMGRVSWEPAVNVVTTISSNDSAKARSAPASSAERITGKVTWRNVRQGSAPRSADASTRDPEVRRNRAMTLL